jgi:hypothetical protein
LTFELAERLGHLFSAFPFRDPQPAPTFLCRWSALPMGIIRRKPNGEASPSEPEANEFNMRRKPTAPCAVPTRNQKLEIRNWRTCARACCARDIRNIRYIVANQALNP